jgi:hypothetical protein
MPNVYVEVNLRFDAFYDACIFLIDGTNEHAASGWLLTSLFIALLVSSIWIALRNWQQDPAQRSMGHLVT